MNIENFEFKGDFAKVAKDYDLRLSMYSLCEEKRAAIARIVGKGSKRRSSLSNDLMEKAKEASTRGPDKFTAGTPMGPLTSKDSAGD